MKKIIEAIAVIAVTAFILTLSACGDTSDEEKAVVSEQTSAVTLTTTVDTATEPADTLETEIVSTIEIFSKPEPDKTIPTPEFEISSYSADKIQIKITSGLDNVDTVRIYHLSVSSDSGGEVTKTLLTEVSAEDISDGTIDVSPNDKLSEEIYVKDNSAIKCGYYSEGYQIEFVNEDGQVLSDYHAVETVIDTGTVNQYNAELAGATACGAAAGTLIIQNILPVWDSELTERMSLIRSYSGLSDEYSIGGDKYYMFGWQISNSVNKFLADSGIGDHSLTDFRTEKTTKETLIELISTGRPAVLEVCYIGGNIVPDFQGYSHWVAVNGFQLTENGYEFRCEDTISLNQRWVASELIDTSNENVSYGPEMTPTRYISSLENAVINSFV